MNSYEICSEFSVKPFVEVTRRRAHNYQKQYRLRRFANIIRFDNCGVMIRKNIHSKILGNIYFQFRYIICLNEKKFKRKHSRHSITAKN